MKTAFARFLGLFFLLSASIISTVQAQTGLQPIQVRSEQTSKILYEVIGSRSLAQYPLTSAGLEAYTTAVTAGQLSLSMTCPNGTVAVIPAGTVPPVVSPCQNQTVVTPAWIAGLRYAHNGTTLTLEGAGAIGTLKFERQGNQPIATTNPDGVTIVSGQYYPYGSISTGTSFTRQWQINLPPVPMRITARQQDTQATYTYLFVPEVTGEERVYLTNPDAGSSAPYVANAMPDQTVTATGTQTLALPTNNVVDPNGSTLTYTALQQNNNALPSGITFNATGRSYSIGSAVVDGTYFLKTIATNPAGQAVEDPFTVFVNRNGGGVNPPPDSYVTAGYGNVFEPNTNFVVQSETTRPTASGPFNRSTITFGQLTLGYNLNAGGATDFLTVAGSENLINNPLYSNTNLLDAGRAMSASAYSYPDGSVPLNGILAGQPGSNGEGHYIEDNQSTEQIDGAGKNSIGWNPVEPGDEGSHPNYAPVHIHHKDANLLFARVQGMQWDLRNVKGKLYTDKWAKADPNNSRAFRMHYRWTMFRDDPYSSHFPTPRQQEIPCIYTVADYSKFYYCAGQPYVNTPLTERVIGESTQQIPFLSSEPFMFAVNPTNGRTICLYAPASGRFTAGIFNFQFGTIYNSDATEQQSAYLNSAVMMSLDKNGVYDFDVAVGEFANLSDARNWAYSQPRWDGKPEYRFDNNIKSRSGWILHHAQDQLEENITDGLIVRPLLDNENYGADMSITAPEKWVDGRVVKHLYIKHANQGSSGAMWLRWKRPGSDVEYYKPFTLSNNGTVQIYDLNLENEPEWAGHDIIQWTIRYQSGVDVTNTQWNFKWISYRNLN